MPDGTSSAPDPERRPATDELARIVYQELRALARRHVRGGAKHHTLQTTELVHEAYARLLGKPKHPWESRAHFLAVAARAMRQILADYARRKGAAKRGPAWERVTLSEAFQPSDNGLDLVSLHEALEELTDLDERKARIVECRFFSGMTVPEIADALSISVSTVEREWRVARAWLGTALCANES